jgi:hypothetical protein
VTSSASGRQATQRHSSKLRGRRAALATIGLVLLVAGCGSPSADRSRSERPAARPADTDLVYAADPAHGQVKVVGAAGRVLRTLPAGVPSPDWRTLYVAGGGADRTTVRAVDVASGRELRSTTIPGKFRLPVVGTAAIPDGLSGDGRTLALVNVADLPVRRFAILPTDFSERPQMVDLPGDFDFDALSPDGARLFVVEHLAGPDRSAYRVRFYDRDAGKLDPNVIVDKRDAWETSMAGYPNTRVVEPGGDWVYTLYRNADNGPFVHALNASDAYAFCIDLPRRVVVTTGPRGCGRWSAARRRAGCTRSTARSAWSPRSTRAGSSRCCGARRSRPSVRRAGRLEGPAAWCWATAATSCWSRARTA